LNNDECCEWTNFGGGNMEFWPSNYDKSNAVYVANASDTSL